jgi:membrane protein
VRIIDRTVAAYEGVVAAARKRSALIDHIWRAQERFSQVLGGRLAAAISYFGFFAAFSLVVVAYSILGRVLQTESDFVTTINTYLTDNLPWLSETAKQVGASEVTAIGSISLVLTGVGWVEALRSSQRAMWLLDQHPGNWFIRRLVDLGMLVGLFLLLGLSLALATGAGWVLDLLTGPATGAVGQTVRYVSTPVLQLMVNVVLAAALVAAVPRLRLSPRRLVPAALIVGVGIQLLNMLGGLFIGRTENRPAYQLVAGAAGLLVYLYLLNQLILYGAAYAATSNKGKMLDLAAGPVPREQTESVGEPNGDRGSEPR